MDDLTSLLMELGDYRSMVQVYEDQLLRGKDMTARSELARKVARMWEEQLEDPREAADAWRRVLRMKAGDVEATTGLERAKSTMLKKPDPDAVDAYAPPKLGPPGTVMPPPPRAPSATPSGSPQAPPSEPKEDPVVDAQAKDGEAPVPEMGEDVDTPIPGVEEDLDTGESAAEGEAQDSEAPAPPDVAPAAPFADVDLAFAQITITTEQKPNPAAPSSEPLIPGDESSGLDLSDLDDPAPVATSSGPSLPEPPRSGPAEEGDILVIDDIAEELEDLDAGAAPPDSNESAPARASSVPPPLPRQ
jgi:hypothetical protein